MSRGEEVTQALRGMRNAMSTGMDLEAGWAGGLEGRDSQWSTGPSCDQANSSDWGSAHTGATTLELLIHVNVLLSHCALWPR